jgi:hypothetical protein
VSLATAKYFNDRGESPLQIKLEPGWQETSRGLALVAWGYAVLVGGSALGAALVWLALDGGGLLGRFGAARKDQDGLLLLGVGAVALTAALSYALVLAGQWRCLLYAPERQSAKEVMYLCINAVLVASVLNVLGAWVDGGRTYAALQGGWDEVARLDCGGAGVLLEAVSAGLGLFASLLFSLFLRSVASCFADRARVLSVDVNLGLVGLLLGGSAGAALYAPPRALHAGLLAWLAGGWLLCFAWHLALVRSLRRSVDAALLSAAPARVLPAPRSMPGAGVLPTHSLSGLRRLAQKQAGC